MSDSDLSSPPSDLENSNSTARKGASRAVSTPKGRKRAAEAPLASTGRSKRRRSGAEPVYKEEDELLEEAEIVVQKTTPKRARKTGKAEAKGGQKAPKLENREDEFVEEEQVAQANESANKKRKSKAKVKRTVEKVTAEETADANGTTEVRVKRKRQTKAEKEAELLMNPLAARTTGSKVLVGAHVSAAGGCHNAVLNSHHIGGNAFALFLKSQRKWANPDLKPEHASAYLSHCKDHGFSSQDPPPIVPHGSYLVNLCHPEPTRAKQAYDSFIDDLSRCRQLCIKLYNFHPGNSAANSNRSDAIAHLANQLNRAHADPQSGTVITLLETMAAVGGNTIGNTFEDLRDAIALINDKSRVGVCLDTCHIFAAGYDIRTPDAWNDTMAKFDGTIGLKYLRALHINDSKAPLASGRDLHFNIGTGFLGLRAFHNIVNDPRIWGLPLILETPIDRKDEKGKVTEDKSIWAREIKLLESLVGMDVESDEFKDLEAKLWKQGESERKRIQEQVDKKDGKRKKDAGKKGKKGKRKKESSESGSESALSELESGSESEQEEFNTQKLGGPSQAA